MNLPLHNKPIKSIIFIILLIVIPTGLLQAAFESYPTSTANLAFGRLNLNNKGNFIDIINFKMKVGEVVWNRPFQINELQQTAFASTFIYKNWGRGISAGTIGNNIYNESLLALGVAKSFKSRLAFGALALEILL
jgi:hypothetical protein